MSPRNRFFALKKFTHGCGALNDETGRLKLKQLDQRLYHVSPKRCEFGLQDGLQGDTLNAGYAYRCRLYCGANMLSQNSVREIFLNHLTVSLVCQN